MSEQTDKIDIWRDDWAEFELLDSGDYRRLERYGDLVLMRPEPRAWWKPDLPDGEWRKASVIYEKTRPAAEKGGGFGADAEDRGEWKFLDRAGADAVRAGLTLKFDGGIRSRMKMAGTSKHVGVFPEQSPQWRWVADRVRAAAHKRGPDSPLKVLNMFAYTGMSTLAAAAAGAAVTHVDGSKVALTWANENAELSGLKDRPIRWILDDALKFVKREVRRGNKYDAIIMDPPAFGRGPKGEVWKVEDSIGELLENCRVVLSPDALFMFVTMYSIEASSLSLGNLVRDAMSGLGGSVTNGELTLRPKTDGKPLPLSLFAAWER